MTTTVDDTDQNLKEIEQNIQLLKKRLGKITCPMCHHNKFVIVSGYISNLIQDKIFPIQINNPIIPAIPLICKNCGFITQHAIGMLDFDLNNEIDK